MNTARALPFLVTTLALALASCAAPSSQRAAYPDDFMDRSTGSANSNRADRVEDRTERREARRWRIADFAYRRGTW